jgi:CBS domain containing-hemolysin-like protein
MIWLAVALCMSVAFAFSGIEAGLLSMNRVRLRHQLKLGDKAAAKLDRLLERPERLLLTVLVVTNFMNTCAIVLATQEIVAALGKRGYLAALVILLPLYLVGFELLPKSLFRRFPYRALAALSELLRITALLLFPLVSAVAAVGWLFLKKQEPEQRKLFGAREDFKYFASESERSGAITKTEREMIHNIVDFRGVTVRDVMVRMDNARTIRADAPLAELLEFSRSSGIDRIPVTDGGGRLVGMVNVFETLLELPPDPELKRDMLSNSTGAYQRRIIAVRALDPAYGALRKLRAARAHVAVAMGESDEQLGIVTAEDLVKRLVSSASEKK